MRTVNRILIIDQGSHSTRAIVHDNAGALYSASVNISAQLRSGGVVEQNPADIILSVFESIHHVLEKMPQDEKASISRVALIVQRSSFLACDKRSGKPMTPVISWQDTRNARYMMERQEHWPMMQAISGLRPNAHYGASKIRWLLDHDPAVKEAYLNSQLVFTPLSSYISKALTGSVEFTVDPVIAARTLLFDCMKEEWSEDLLHFFDIDPSSLPRIVANCHDFGCVEVGDQSIPLTLVGGDQSYVGFAAGMPMQANVAYVNIGSGAFIQVLGREPSIDARLLKSVLHSESGNKTWVVEGTVNAASTALDWLWQFSGEELSPVDMEKALLAEIAIPVFINTVAGVGSPHWHPAREPAFIGSGSLRQMAVAVIESIAFALADNLHIQKEYNQHVDKIIVGGGLSRYEGLCQKLADVTKVNVARLNQHEMAVQGLASFIFNVAYNERKIDKTYTPKVDVLLQERYQLYQANIAKVK